MNMKVFSITRLKKFLIVFAALAVIIAAAFCGGVLFQSKASEQPEPEITAELISGELIGLAELAVLEYRYTNVGKYENRVDFYGWQVPFTEKSFIISYDGAVKLGIDADFIQVSVSDTQICIGLPEILILSHEILEDTIMVMDQSNSLFNRIKIEDYLEFAADQTAVMEEKIEQSDLISEARENARDRIEQLITRLPGIGDKYSIVFSDLTIDLFGN